MKPPFFLLACVFSVTHSLGTDSPSRADLPNIVFILADDLGYGDLGCYNQESKIPTPRLDRFAGEGMRFTDAHSPILGLHPDSLCVTHRTLCMANTASAECAGAVGQAAHRAGSSHRRQALQQHGYATACIGKWHLGQTYVTKDGNPPMGGAKNALSNVDFTQAITDGPITRGFDHYFGTIVPNYPPYCFIQNDRTVGVPSLLTPVETSISPAPWFLAGSWKTYCPVLPATP